MDPSKRISLVPVPSNVCSRLLVVKKSEASGSMHNVGVMVPVMPVSSIYANMPPSTSQTVSFTDTSNSKHQGHYKNIAPVPSPTTSQQSQMSLCRTMTYTPYPSEVSLSSLGRPWQMERLWYTKNPSNFQMTDMHLWPPPPLCAKGEERRGTTASMVHQSTLRKIPNSGADKLVKAEPPDSISERSNNTSNLMSSPVSKIGHIKSAMSMLGDDSDDDSSYDSLYLDEGCEMFDEDLEPLDLKVRPSPRSALVPEIVSIFPGSSTSTQPNRDHRRVPVPTSPTYTGNRAENEMRYSSDGAMDMRIGAMMGEGASGCNSQEKRLDVQKRSNECRNLPKVLKLPDRNMSVPIKKQRKYKMQANRPERKHTKIMSVRICQKCKCDFRSTMFQECPLCNASYIVENPSRASNSTLSCLISLPAQLSLSQSNNRVSIIAKIELRPGTILGPLVGKNIDPKSAPTLSKPESIWVTEMATSGITQVLSTENEAESNWLRYVLLGDVYYNTAIIARRAKLFFVTTETISTGQELVLRPYNPLIAHLNGEHTTKCQECQNNYASPLYLANHRAIVHPRASRSKVKPAIFTAIQHKGNTKLPLLNPEQGATLQRPAVDHDQPKSTLPRPHQDLHQENTTLPRPDRVLERPKSTLPIPNQSLEQPKCTLLRSDQPKSNLKGQQMPLCLSVKKKRKAKGGSKSSAMQKQIVKSEQCHQVPPRALDKLQKIKTPSPEKAATPLKCEYCGKAFERKQSFRRHVISHQTKNETLPSRTCKDCGRQFYSSSNLKVHMLTHSGVKPFTCKLGDCAIGFTTKQSLQLHYIKRHGMNYDTMPPIERNVPFTLDGYRQRQINDGQSATPDSSLPIEIENSKDSIVGMGRNEIHMTGGKSSSGECGSIPSVYDRDAVDTLNQPSPDIKRQSLSDTLEQPLTDLQWQHLADKQRQPLAEVSLPNIQECSLPDTQGHPLSGTK